MDQNLTDEVTTITGNEDTVVCNFYCKFTDKLRDNIILIHEAMTNAQDPLRDEETKSSEFICEENSYIVKPRGIGGASTHWNYYKYAMEDSGIMIAFQTRECGSKYEEEDNEKIDYRPNVKVEISSLAMMVSGSFTSMMNDVENRLNNMGFIIMKNRMNRVDPCIDIEGEIGNLQMCIPDRQYISRAKKSSLYEENDSVIYPEFDDDEENCTQRHYDGIHNTGFTIGKGKLMCRAYDKLAESKHDETKLSAIAERRFNGILPDNVMRVEFQIRTEALRAFAIEGKKDGIETWQDWARYRAAITKYLCTQWLVFASKAFIRSHSNRIMNNELDWHPDWRKVVNAFKEAYGNSELRVSRLEKVIKREAKAAIAQSIGNDQSAMMKTTAHISRTDPEWIKKIALFRYYSTFAHLEDEERQKAFWRNWDEKLLRMDASTPPEAISPLIKVASYGAGVTHSSPEKTLEALLAA